MRPDPAFLDADAIRAATFIRQIEIHDTLGSTNDRALELARDPEIELPALVVARSQTAGRGRGKNVWWSAEGALTFSILLEPTALGIGAPNWPQLSLASGVAICDALSEDLAPQNAKRELQSGRLRIKRPNDVLLDGGKVAGILIESPGGLAPAKDRLIIGIGINVNNAWSQIGTDLKVSGTSLCDITGRKHHLEPIVIRLMVGLRTRLYQLAKNDPQYLNDFRRLEVNEVCSDVVQQADGGDE
jgi:BirA family transcriptional regulator, biotin operon repressor / biotin---[acetyl-CoA-carboxylase] ligase